MSIKRLGISSSLPTMTSLSFPNVVLQCIMSRFFSLLGWWSQLSCLHLWGWVTQDLPSSLSLLSASQDQHSQGQSRPSFLAWSTRWPSEDCSQTAVLQECRCMCQTSRRSLGLVQQLARFLQDLHTSQASLEQQEETSCIQTSSGSQAPCMGRSSGSWMSCRSSQCSAMALGLSCNAWMEVSSHKESSWSHGLSCHRFCNQASMWSWLSMSFQNL